MTGSSLFGLLGRNKGHYSQSSTPSAERNPERLPGSPGDELPLNRTSTIHRENQQAISSAGSVSNGSGSSIPAGCCAFLITGLRQGVSFISLIKDQEYPEAVTSRKTMLMWLHACASIGYSLGRMTGGPPRSCFLFRSKPTLKYSYPSDRPDPAGIAFVSSEFHNLFVEAAKKVSRDGPLPSLPAESASAIQPLSPQVTGLLPQVVVMMPIYAKSRLSLERLNQALDVLSTQALMPTAVLLIDDCGPVNLVEYFQVSISPRFTLKQRRSGKEGIALSGVWRGSLQVLVLRLEANHGPAFARNVGLKAASAALPSPAATNPPSANNSARGSLAPANPRSPQLPYQMVVACFLDLGCIPSSNQWTFHHASAQASIGGVNHGGAFNEERRNSTVSKASSRSSRAGAGRELWAGKLGGIVVGRGELIGFNMCLNDLVMFLSPIFSFCVCSHGQQGPASCRCLPRPFWHPQLQEAGRWLPSVWHLLQHELSLASLLGRP